MCGSPMCQATAFAIASELGEARDVAVVADDASAEAAAVVGQDHGRAWSRLWQAAAESKHVSCRALLLAVMRCPKRRYVLLRVCCVVLCCCFLFFFALFA